MASFLSKKENAGYAVALMGNSRNRLLWGFGYVHADAG